MPDRLSEIDQLNSALRTGLSEAEQALVDAAVAAEPAASRTYGFAAIGGAAQTALERLAVLPGERAALASRTAIAGLLHRNGARLGAGLPPKVGERTAAVLDWLVPWLAEPPESDYAYPGDLFLKDYRFATGLTVPCGAQVVDLAERPGIKGMAAAAVQKRRRVPGIFLAPWLRPHTESRYLDEFNEAGWNRCYAEMVDLLTARPAVVGMIATSWFYDPALATVSPRLAYLRGVPVTNGAAMARHGTTPFDIDSATATSPTRRALYDAGRYKPECWSILWLRDDMIAWRARNPDA